MDQEMGSGGVSIQDKKGFDLVLNEVEFEAKEHIQQKKVK